MTMNEMSEYLIRKYGNGKAVPSESGFIDNLYCKIRNIISSSVRKLINTLPITQFLTMQKALLCRFSFRG